MPSPATISLEAAIAMTHCSRRTWWRRIERGSVTKLPADARGRTMLLLEEVWPDIVLPLAQEDVKLLVQADSGHALAQAEAGALFALAHQKSRRAVVANQPTSQPANQPTSQPANQPTSQPANQPTSQPAILSLLPCIGWNWPQRKARRMPCTGWACSTPAATAVTTASIWR